MKDEIAHYVRQHDPDRFLLSLFMPRRHRAAFWAVLAFNIEISKTRYVVSETQIGHIRLQWWRDGVREIYEGKTPRAHFVLEPLAQAIKSYDLPQDLFEALIYAREFDLEGVPPDNIEGLLAYCDYTNAPLIRLGCKITGEAYNDAGVVGISKRYGLIGAIRAVPYMLSDGVVMIPNNILQQHNMNAKKLIDFNKKDEIPQLIKSVFMAYEVFRYDSCGQKQPVFLRKMAHIARLYEAQIKSVDCDVFNAKLSLPPKFLALRLLMGS